MNREEAIAIIRKEYLCVDRDCDIERSCGKCDLMMPSKEPILEAYSMAIKALEQTRWVPVTERPAVNPTKTEKWISVSERLPEDRREVLVTAYWHETYQVMMASYFGDGLWWCVPFNNCGEHMQRLKPKAWMPLPTPYEPHERSGKE
jgi:hypothetical protein